MLKRFPSFANQMFFLLVKFQKPKKIEIRNIKVKIENRPRFKEKLLIFLVELERLLNFLMIFFFESFGEYKFAWQQ